MFKKASTVQQQRRLSGADTKKLRRSMREKFAHASDEDLDKIIPSKVEVNVSKMSNKSVVYSVDGGLPVIFDADGRGDIYPTVYALWKVPDLLPAFTLKGGEVSRYMLSGADLMFPGIDVPPSGLPSFKAGEVWSIKVPHNNCPIAVGCTLVSSSEAAQVGLRGKALKVMHYYRDTLWESAEGRYIPNAGFKEDIVVEDDAVLAADNSTSGSGAPAAEGGSQESGDNAVGSNIESESVVSRGGSAAGTESGSDRQALDEQEPLPDLESMKILEGQVVDEETGLAAATSLQTTEDMDRLLDQCLLQALHTTVKDKDLPLASSSLWSQHILPCRPPGVSLDIKKSTHKKLSKWLQAKASSGLISAREDKHRKEMMLLKINRRHDDFVSFTPQKLAPPEEQASTSGAPAGPEAATVEVVEVWKCAPAVAKIFEAVGADPGSYLSAQEATQVVQAYVEKENLDKRTDRSFVVLDPTLCDALYKGAVKKGTAYPTEIAKRDLGPIFLHRMQAHHKVSRGGESVVRKGALKEVQIVTERRSGNKKVTRLTGMESFLVDADSLAAELQKRFACSTAVADVPGKKNEKEVLVQGGVLEDLARHLIQHYGIPKAHIEVMDKTRK